MKRLGLILSVHIHASPSSWCWPLSVPAHTYYALGLSPLCWYLSVSVFPCSFLWILTSFPCLVKSIIIDFSAPSGVESKEGTKKIKPEADCQSNSTVPRGADPIIGRESDAGLPPFKSTGEWEQSGICCWPGNSKWCTGHHASAKPAGNNGNKRGDDN